MPRRTNDPDTSAIGIRLESLRREHRYSIRKLAEQAGVSASLISDVERGKVEPSISTLKRLAAALGTTLAFFFSEPSTVAGRVVRVVPESGALVKAKQPLIEVDPL